MLQILIQRIPLLIILAALLYYLVKKRNMLGGILFISYLASFVINLLRIQLAPSIRHNLKQELRMMTLLGYLSSIAYTIFAIAFLMLIINILKPRAVS